MKKKRLKRWSFYAVCVYADGQESFYTNHGLNMARLAPFPERKFATEDEAKKVMNQLVKEGVYKKSEVGVSRIAIGFHWCDDDTTTQNRKDRQA